MRSERWSEPFEIKKALVAENSEAGGPVIYSENGTNWVYSDEKNVLFLGLTGVGKSRRGTIPMIRSIIRAKESFIAVDPKGEIYKHTDCYVGEDYAKHVIDFRHVYHSERINPLAPIVENYRGDDLEKKQMAMEMVDELAFALFPLPEKGDPFWAQSARSVFVGAVYALMDCAKDDEINMASVYQFIAQGDNNMHFGSRIDALLESMPEESLSSMLLQGYANTASDTRAGIKSTFLDGLSLFARSQGIMSMLGGDDIGINSLNGEEPAAIYLILPDESPIYDSIAGIICNQLLNHYVKIAQNKYDGRLPIRLNVCLEELGNIGRAMPALPHLMSAGRSRNIRCFLVLQSLSQLNSIYGASASTTIRSNADVIVAYRTNHRDTLVELSNICGDREIHIGGQVIREPLITPAQLAAMETGQALVIISGRIKFIANIPDYADIYDVSDWEKPKPPKMDNNEPAPIFSIANYVKGKKCKNKVDDMEINLDKIFPMPQQYKDIEVEDDDFMVNMIDGPNGAEMVIQETESYKKRKKQAGINEKFSEDI